MARCVCRTRDGARGDGRVNGGRSGDGVVSAVPEDREPLGPRSSLQAALRTIRGQLSQSEVARRSGLSHSYVSRLENGERTPTRDALLAIARACAATDRETDWLLMAGGFMPTERAALLSDEPRLAEIYATLDGDDVPDHIRQAIRVQLAAIVAQVEVLMRGSRRAA